MSTWYLRVSYLLNLVVYEWFSCDYSKFQIGLFGAMCIFSYISSSEQRAGIWSCCPAPSSSCLGHKQPVPACRRNLQWLAWSLELATRCFRLSDIWKWCYTERGQTELSWIRVPSWWYKRVPGWTQVVEASLPPTRVSHMPNHRSEISGGICPYAHICHMLNHRWEISGGDDKYYEASHKVIKFIWNLLTTMMPMSLIYGVWSGRFVAPQPLVRGEGLFDVSSESVVTCPQVSQFLRWRILAAKKTIVRQM